MTGEESAVLEYVAETRLWLTLGLATAGAILAYRTYRAGARQRRLENSFKMIDLFGRVVSNRDLELWGLVFERSGEPAPAKRGHFVERFGGEGERCEPFRRSVLPPEGEVLHEDEVNTPFSDLFSEGAPDDGAVERMAEVFDLIGYEALEGTLDLRIVYFELGQLMDTVHSWLETIPEDEAGSFFRHFPSFHKLYTSRRIDASWTRRTHAHIE